MDGVAAAMADGTAAHTAVKGLGKLIGIQSDVLRRHGFRSVEAVRTALQVLALPCAREETAAGGAGASCDAAALDLPASARAEAVTGALALLAASQHRWSATLARLEPSPRSAATAAPRCILTAQSPTADVSPSASAMRGTDSSPAAVGGHHDAATAQGALASGAPLPQFSGTLLRCCAHQDEATGGAADTSTAVCCTSVSSTAFDSEQWFSCSLSAAAAAAAGVAAAPAAAATPTSGAASCISDNSVARASTLLVFLRHSG